MKTIVITGKSGSGKTYVAEKLATVLDCEILSLDKISHKTLETETLKTFVYNSFGKDVFDENGNIIRKKIGEIAFKNPILLQDLNKVAEIEMEKIIDNHLSNTPADTIILEYALLPKMKYFSNATLKILVVANDNIRQSRIIERDNISKDYFEIRDKNSLEYDESDYDFVVSNNETASNITEVINQIKKSTQK